jgi:hypothetical protein
MNLFKIESKVQIFMLIVLFLVIFLAGNQKLSAKEDYNWNQLKQRYKYYLSHKSDISQKSLLEILPKEEVTNLKDADDTIDYIFNNFAILEEGAKAGDLDTINILVRLRRITDGANSEYISILLGKIIAVHPEVFLMSLKENLDNITRLDSLLCNLGPKYVDKIYKQTEELERRYLALREVDNKSLAKVKDLALYILSKEISRNRINIIYINYDQELLNKVN